MNAYDIQSSVQFDSDTFASSHVEAVPGLDDGEAHLVDAIAQRWKCTVQEALSRLLTLEMDGRVQQLPGQRFAARG